MNTFLLMCWEFFKTGLFAVGGGLATIPFLKEMSVKYGWFTLDRLTTMIAVAESTPGPVGINMATYVGYEMFGIPGAICATLSLITPSIIVILIVSRILDAFRESRTVKAVFDGFRPAVVGFILAAVLSIYRTAMLNNTGTFPAQFVEMINWKAVVLYAGLLALYLKKDKLHPLVIICLAAAAGALFSF
ncbi:MAG: chromate transporter [Solobacterium sp.]|jgi:chromate transporter|nr:chromate transporter [Solobacterium sp.]